MTVIEKRAWFVLAFCLMAVVAVVIIYGFTQSFGRAMSGMAVLGFTGVTPWIGSRQKRRGEIVVDERDRAILESAGRIAFGTVWVAAVGAVFGVLYVAGEASAVHVSTIVWAVWLAWLVLLIVHSSSVLWISRLPRAR